MKEDKENKGKITRTISEGDGSCYGYHVNHISKGVLGYLSKIQEELDEAKDFESQNNPVGVLLELSDLLGAVDAYLKKRHPSISLWDLVTMFEATHRAFTCGERFKREEKDFTYLEDTFADVKGTPVSSSVSGGQIWTCNQNQDKSCDSESKNYLKELLTPKVIGKMTDYSKKCIICGEVDCEECDLK